MTATTAMPTAAPATIPITLGDIHHSTATMPLASGTVLARHGYSCTPRHRSAPPLQHPSFAGSLCGHNTSYASYSDRNNSYNDIYYTSIQATVTVSSAAMRATPAAVKAAHPNDRKTAVPAVAATPRSTLAALTSTPATIPAAPGNAHRHISRTDSGIDSMPASPATPAAAKPVTPTAELHNQ